LSRRNLHSTLSITAYLLHDIDNKVVFKKTNRVLAQTTLTVYVPYIDV